MSANLARKVARRKALRTHFEGTITEVKNCLSNAESTEARLIGLKASLTEQLEQLSAIDEEIVNALDPVDVEVDVLASMKFFEPTHEVLASISLKLNAIKISDSDSSSVQSTRSAVSITGKCKLPKLELPIFTGNPLEWQGFWDQFNVSIHLNETISDIDRFNYLKKYLSGKALSTVTGLALSSENYKSAIALLTERFGNPQVLISAHLDALIKVKRVKSMESLDCLRKMCNEVETCVRNLKSLKVETATYGCLLIPILKEKIPDDLLMIISRRFAGNVWTLEEFLNHLNEELQAKESCVTFSKGSSTSGNQFSGVSTGASLHAHVQEKRSSFASSFVNKCVYCLNKHPPSKCDKVTDVNARKNVLKKFSKCFLCLKGGHVAKNCTSSYICRKCDKKHHISICSNSSNAAQVEQAVINHVGVYEGILLQTARVCVSNCESSNDLTTRILFDSGSQRSYITQSLREKLNLKTIRTERIILKTFGQSDSVIQSLDVVRIRVKNRLADNFIYLEVLCVPFICSPLTKQTISLTTQRFPKLKGLSLADFDNDSSNFLVGILVGLDYYHSCFTGKLIKTVGGPTAMESNFGWVLSGPSVCKDDLPSSSSLCSTVHVMRCSFEEVPREDDKLRQDLDRFWNIENISNSNECVVRKFENDIMYNGARYVTKLPFRPDHDLLPENFTVSEARLKNLKVRLNNNQLLKEYDDIFKEYEANNIIEKVPDEELEVGTGSVHYLPHRPVIRDDKETTKIRAVFDASCSNNGPSLNDCLYPGPNLLCKIFDILLRFRLNPVAILADIKQAFLNVEIAQEHRNFLRFLWYDDLENSKVTVYRFLRLVFGLTSSPFVLNGTIRHHLSKFLDSEREFVEKFLEDLYVDDTTTGCESVKEGITFYEKSMSIMSAAGFCLRKWVSNNESLQTYFDEKQKQECKSGSRKVLGVEWDIQSDEFIFSFAEILALARSLAPTKRNVLKIAATFFDPLGFISPITARVKTIFQMLCKDKSEWDAEISEDILLVWNQFLSDLEIINAIRAKRFSFVEIKVNIISVTMHGFCDSSLKIYCGVVYLQVKTSMGLKVYFLAAKTKVAPLKEVTIPRLELLGCVLLSSLIQQIDVAISERVVIDKKLCWSDSEVALCWIKGKSRVWKPWVENRVVKIRKVVDCENWNHVAGCINPADIATRICSVDDFQKWFRGSQILYDDDYDGEYFDVSKKLNMVDVVVESRKVSKVRGKIISANVTTSSLINMTVEGDNLNCVGFKNDVSDFGKDKTVICSVAMEVPVKYVTEDKKSDNPTHLVNEIIDIDRFSNLTKLINTTGYVFRFINNLKARVNQKRDLIISDETLTMEEYDYALKQWVKAEQWLLTKRKDYQKLKASLRLFLCDDGCLRLKGRFAYASSMEYGQKYPILLRSGESYFTRLVVMDAHENVLHHGIETSLNYIRANYWIIKGRKTLKDILRKCVICKRYQGRVMLPPETPDLPDFRVNSVNSFHTVGLDFAGPLHVKDFNKDAVLKVYILLFTCATSRAIHVELTPNMNNSAFIRAFHRFIARKGKPSHIIHDNFKTFKSKMVKRFLLQNSIKQKCILPASPWWGGFYERLVRSVKLSLRKTLGRSLLNYEELETVLCDVESIINSRPLSYISEDDMEESLTPYHLMFGRNVIKASPFTQSEDVNISSDLQECSKRLKYLRKLIGNYWKRFSTTYLNELRQMHIYRKEKTGMETLALGDVVLIRDDNRLPRQKWRLGKVEELVVGNDGNVRGAKLKVASSTGEINICHRPVQKLVPFEIIDKGRSADTDKHDKGVIVTSKRPTRKAAKEGELLRQLRDKYC